MPKRTPWDGPLCGYTKHHNGEPCRLPAGWGTDHRGTGSCAKHGGKTQFKRGKKNPQYKTGQYCRKLSPEEQVEYEQFCATHSWLKPTEMETLVFFLALKMMLNAALGKECTLLELTAALDKMSAIKLRYKQLLERTTRPGFDVDDLMDDDVDQAAVPELTPDERAKQILDIMLEQGVFGDGSADPDSA